MESWHGTKINKYLPLKTMIESKGWCVELFTVEVGATGYCSKSVLCCFKKLGFNNKLIRNTIKKLSKSSMECSFCIWLARNNKEWTPSVTNCIHCILLNDFKKETYHSQSSMSPLKQTNKPGSNAKSLLPVGLLCQFHLADFKCHTHPLEQSPFRIKHFITYVTSHQSQHGHKKEFKQTC